MHQRPPVIAQQQFEMYRETLRKLSLQERFSVIYQMNIWDADNTRSGVGSERAATKELASYLPNLFREYNILTLIDAPCGDYNWLSYIDLPIGSYTGLDIVPELIQSLNQDFSLEQKRFELVDITKGPVPTGDLILCRDCLVHLSYENIRKVIYQFKVSKTKWLLTTHFTDATENCDIVDGDWRVINFCYPPFNWPKPGVIINENCLEMNGAYADKSLAMWELAELPVDL